MRFIKLAAISFFVLFILVTMLGLLLPSTVRVTRNINIGAPSDSLYHNISDLKNWSRWMEGIDADAIKFTSPKVNGKMATAMIGKLQINFIKSTEKEVVTSWQNSRGTSQLCVFQLSADTAASITNVNWYFEQKVSWYPWERLPTLANDKILGPFMEQSLDKLKTILERTNH